MLFLLFFFVLRVKISIGRENGSERKTTRQKMKNKKGVRVFMSTIQKYLLKSGAAVALAGLFAVANQTEASAQDFSVENWEPRTVSQIAEEIEEQIDEQEEASSISYTFQWGDTLWGISEATDISVEKLVQVNDIDDRSLIQVDTTIYLSEDASVISVQNDDGIVSYDISEEEVEETETPEAVEESIQEEPEEQEAEVQEEVQETETQEQAQESETQTESSEGYWINVEATAYSLNQPELGNITFSGIDLRNNPRVIAVDPNVIPLGSTIYVPGYGEYIAGDTGGAINGNRIDIHMTDLNEAINFGRRNLEVQVIQ